MSTKLSRVPVSKAALQSAQRTQRVPLQSPWRGYTPDSAIPTEMPNGLTSCRALVVSGGALTLDHGWEQLGADDLPLGHNTGALGFTDSAAATYGAGIAPGTAAQSQPIRHLASFQRFKAGSGIGVAEVLAITADTGGGAGANQDTGHLFSFSGTPGAWTSVEFDSNDGGGAVVANAVPLSGGTDDWVDSAVYALGVTGGALAGETVQAVAESVFVFTNYQDEVMYYPNVTDGTNYTDFRSYSQQLDDLGAAAGIDFYSGNNTHLSNFRARTLAVFDGRMWYGNTVEDNAFFGTRLRRSIVGNPFIVNPGFEITDAATPINLNGVGSGYIDLEQLKTPIQRILPLGDLLAVYSKDGIALVRRTGSDAAPYAVQYLTLERGVLSSSSVVSINPAQHFAIMNDGWYTISANGTLQEVGVARPGPLKTGEINYKWKEDFYSRLNLDSVNQNHISLGYDPQEYFVRIAAPFGVGFTYTDDAPVSHQCANQVWIYDLKNDRVFLDDYRGINGRNQTPLCWANVIISSGEASLTWAEVTASTATPWSGLDDPGSWAAITPTYGGNASVVHGDLNGYVYAHDTNLTQRDGTMAEWQFVTVTHNYGDVGAGERMLQRVDIQYENCEADASPSAGLSVTGLSNTGPAGSAESGDLAVIYLSRGQTGQMGFEYAHFKVTGDHHRISMAGAGQVKLHAIGLEIQVLEGRYRREEGTILP